MAGGRITVRFEPDGRSVETSVGPNLLELAREADVDVYSPCGGQGLCGRCAVQVEGDFERLAPPPPHLDREKGLVLACQARPTGDVTVTVPAESRTEAAQILEESREGLVELSPMVHKVYLELPQPSISDNVCDLMRITKGLGMGLRELQAPIELVRYVSGVLRRADWKVTATVTTDAEPPRLLRVDSGDTTHRAFGIAIDLGTTTVVGKIVSLVDGSVISSAARENAQIAFGEDVIARIAYANDNEDGLDKLQLAVLGTVGEVISELAEESGAERDEIISAVLAGNTIMEHLFLGVSPEHIRLEPYVPSFCQLSDMPGRVAGLDISQCARTYLMPSRAGFVGGDITADVLACGMHKREETAMMIDVGTNGEVVLGNQEWLMACSCSAGPAFEGGEVRHGMRAGRGAIERIEIDESLEVNYETIGGTAPRGICGSGLIDLVAELFYHDFVDRAGSLTLDDARVIKLEDVHDEVYGKAFVVVPAGETAHKRPIFITEDDIKNLLRTKAAMYAACSLLVRSAGISFDDLDRVYISGGFGRFLDSWKSRLLGLLPDIEEWRFEFIGNGSLEGARLALLSRTARREAKEIFSNMTYLELSVMPEFMNEFTSALFLPHTELDRFPTVREALDSRPDVSPGAAEKGS